MAQPIGGSGKRKRCSTAWVIRDKTKSADLATLQAYRTVAHDLFEGPATAG